MEIIIRKSYLYGYDNFEVIITNENYEEKEIQIHGEQNLNELIEGFEFLGFSIQDER